MNQNKPIFVSDKQLEAIETFFDPTTEDMLYGGAARGGKSESIGIILAICIAYFPGSEWLLSRTQLADLKATTLATFFSVIKRFGYGEDTYRDKIRDERHILFNNDSKLFVIQVNDEPSDPNFDRIGSYGYTGAFLDEGQQMSNKVREVAKGRLSKKRGSFTRAVNPDLANVEDDKIKASGDIEFLVVQHVLSKDQEEEVETKIRILEGKLDNGEYNESAKSELTDQIEREKRDLLHIRDIKSKEYLDIVEDSGRIHYITRKVTLKIPYTFVKAEMKGKTLLHTYEWKYKGCIFTGCNPGTNFTRSDFYKPWKVGGLEYYKSFIPAKVNDNPWVDRQYIEALERLPEESIIKQRLLYGNFDFDDNENILFDERTIEIMFKQKDILDNTHYITVDLAGPGKDKTQIGVWRGLHLKEIITIENEKHTDQAKKIEALCHKYSVDITNNVIVDEIGMGRGMVDMLGCVGFVGNSSAISPFAAKFLSWKKQNYKNLRTQAFYYLQKYHPQVYITTSQQNKEMIIEELLTVEEINIAKDTTLQIVSKKEMKKKLSRSPDLIDMISMRMWWIIKYDSENSTEDDTIVETEKKDPLWDYITGLDQKEVEFDADIY